MSLHGATVDELAQSCTTLVEAMQRLLEATHHRSDTGLVRLTPAPYVTVSLAAKITGPQRKAIRLKIEDGKWIAG